MMNNIGPIDFHCMDRKLNIFIFCVLQKKLVKDERGPGLNYVIFKCAGRHP